MLYCCAPRDIHGNVPSMHLDGMKQEEVAKSNLLGRRSLAPGFCNKKYVLKQEENKYHMLDIFKQSHILG